jgi:predicted ATPase/DNA-binding SARP family transcriptional activator
MGRPEAPLEIRILGPLEVVSGGARVSLGGRKQREVLAFLATRAETVVSADALIEAIWPSEAPPSALPTLQVYVSRLRKLLGADAIVTEGGGYRLAVDARGLDAARFTELTTAAADSRTRGRGEDGTDAIRAALSLWRGPPLSEFAYQPWAQPEIARLEEQRLACLEEHFELELALARHAGLVAELQRLVQEHPLRERLRGQLMLALYRSGRQAEALAAYQDARTTLVEELGIDPSPELQELNRAILNQDPAIAARRRVDGERTPDDSRTKLPIQATRFLGRERELGEVRDLLSREHVRLLTLTGPGGTGKTRLALELAGSVASRFPAGAWFVDLAPLRDAALVLETVAQTLGVHEQADEPLADTLAEHLRGKEMLLVLDNFEHVLGAALALGSLLARLPQVKLLATSRVPLRLSAEHVYPVPPLALPDQGAPLDPDELARCEAVALFLERAEAAGSDVRLTAENADAVAEVCVRLDGLPLALELAAARTTVLSPHALRERLDDRLGILTRSPRDAVERQRTLRAAIDWSYDLLEGAEKTLFRCLAVFTGGCTLDAAEKVCGGSDTVETLASLVDFSLVRCADGGDSEPRFAMLETIREYASALLDRSGERDVLRRAHAAYFARRADRGDGEGGGEREELWARELAADEDNLRGALDSLLADNRGDDAVRLCLSLAQFWEIRDRMAEGARWFERALALPGDRRLRAKALNWYGVLMAHANDRARAAAIWQEACDLAREIDDREALAWGIFGLAMSKSWFGGEGGQATELLVEALALQRENGDRKGERTALQLLGEAQADGGDFEAAARSFEASIALSRSLDDDVYLLATQHSLGDLELVRGNDAAAEEHYRTVLRSATEIVPLITAWCVGGLAATAARRDARARAASLWAAVERFEADRGVPLDARVRARYEAALDGIDLPPAGEALPLHEAVRYALAD